MTNQMQKIPQRLRHWILHSGSFMQRLQQQGVKNAEVQVLQTSWCVPEYSERKALRISARQFAWVREVLIASGDQYWMFARTVFPQQTLTGAERQLFFL